MGGVLNFGPPCIRVITSESSLSTCIRTHWSNVFVLSPLSYIRSVAIHLHVYNCICLSLVFFPLDISRPFCTRCGGSDQMVSIHFISSYVIDTLDFGHQKLKIIIHPLMHPLDYAYLTKLHPHAHTPVTLPHTSWMLFVWLVSCQHLSNHISLYITFVMLRVLVNSSSILSGFIFFSFQ